MPLIDDVVFYGSRVAAGDMDRETAARLLAEHSQGLLTVRGAEQAIDTWEGVRDRMRSLHAVAAAEQRAQRRARAIAKFRRRHGGES